MSFGCWDSPWDQSLRLLGAEQEITAFFKKTERSKSVWVSESAPHQTISVSRPLGTKAEASLNLNDSIIMAHSFVEAHNFPKEREHGLWGKSSTQEAVSGRRWAVVSTHQSTVGLTATHLLCTLWPFLMNKMFLPHTKRLKNQSEKEVLRDFHITSA